MKGAGCSTREIAQRLGIARNTVRRYLNTPEAMVSTPRKHRASKLDPYTEYIDRRIAEGLENCVVLRRELRDLGYQGWYSILKAYVSPRRRQLRPPQATVRFETVPGEQAHVRSVAGGRLTSAPSPMRVGQPHALSTVPYYATGSTPHVTDRTLCHSCGRTPLAYRLAVVPGGAEHLPVALL